MKYALIALTLFSFTSTLINGQTTAFNYQGRLTDGGNPANGSFQMQFKLFDAVAAGSQIGSTISDVAVMATNGTFSAKLDFGAAAFGGANRWLEIAVRRNSSESYVTLSPREQIASSPYAVRTLSAATADDSQKLGGLDAANYVTSTNGGTSFIRNQTTLQPTSNFNISGNGLIGGLLGVGTPTDPFFRGDFGGPVRSLAPSAAHFVAQTTGGTNSWARFYMRTNNRSWFMGTSQNFNADQLYLVDETAGQTRMAISTAGLVGINNTSPQAGLHLAGTGAQVQERITDNTSGNSLVLQAGDAGNMKVTGFNYGSGTAVPIYLSVDGANTIVNPNGGNFGIGTTTPNGKLTVIGNSTQDRNSFGFPKAMIYVNGDATIIRCYNGTNGSSSGDCGFAVSRQPGAGNYLINFGFQITDRFWVTSVQGGCCTNAISIHVGFSNTTTLSVLILTQAAAGTDRPFMMVVY
jgi:hypothetical protein